MLLLHMQEIVPVDFQAGPLSSRGGGGPRHPGSRLTPGDVTNPIFARSTRLKYKSLERINMSYKIVDLT